MFNRICFLATHIHQPIARLEFRTEMDVLVLGNYYTTDRNQASIDRAIEDFARDHLKAV